MILKPYKGFTVLDVTQGFHSGHKAIDCVPRKLAYGTPLVAPEKVRIDEIRTPTSLSDNFNTLEKGYGVWMFGLETGNRYLYWHTMPILPVWGGDVVEKGTIVAYMGNSGNVLVGGVYVPIAERNHEPHRGTHLHEVVQVGNVPVDPLPLIDVVTEPTYTMADQIVSIGKVVAKLSKLFARL